MAVEPWEFLSSADESLERFAEIHWRNAVSRAYYGVYHQASVTIRRLGWPEYAAGSTHDRLSALFVDQGKKALGYRLKHLHRVRCNADYNISDHLSLSCATDHVAAAKGIVGELDRLID